MSGDKTWTLSWIKLPRPQQVSREVLRALSALSRGKGITQEKAHQRDYKAPGVVVPLRVLRQGGYNYGQN
jgi:hypothetical protein